MTSKRKIIFTTLALVGVLVIAVGIAFASHGDNVDVTSAGSTVLHDGAYYIQGPLPSSAGTGLIDPFLTVGGGGSQDITAGYNTDGTAEFDTVTGGDRTHSLNLAAVPEQEYDGVIYKEFVLDINKAPGGSPFLALNELQLFLTDDPNITGYPFTGTATKIFDLDEGPDGDIAILMDYSLESGSGASDLTWLVPLSVFDGDLGDCNYGNTACTTYVVMYNQYGNYVEEGADLDKWVNNDGFEEWGTVLRPVVEVTKDAAGTYDRTVDWTIEKSVDPDSHGLFAGGPAGTSGYSITVTKNETVGNIAAGGTITILNPTGGAGNPIEEDINAVILSVEDVITQGAIETDATVNCGVTFPYTLNAGDTLVCTYTASPGLADSGVNEATATIEGLDGPSTFSGTADLAFTENLIGYDTINVDDTNPGGDFGPVSSTTTHTYSESFDCADVTYVNGVATYEVPNTATIVEEDESSGANVTVNCYAPVITKDAAGSYDERHTWDVEKSVDPTSQDAFAGDPVSWTWTVDVSESSVDEKFAVTGNINVTNPAGSPGDMTVSLADALNDGTDATVTCPGGGSSVTVAPGATGTCSYSASPADASATLNTATGTFNSIDFTGTAPVSFTASVINGTATIDDDQEPDFPLTLNAGEGPWQWTETDNDACSSDTSFYAGDGTYSFGDNNTATVTGSDGQSDSASASTTVNCYAPVITKDAAGSYDERHTWDVEKSVDPTSQSGFPGDTLPWTWTVTLSESSVDEKFAVTGNINVANPAGSPGNMTVSLADALNDGTDATVTCPGGGSSVTVAPGATGTCSYSASPADASATLNTATGTFNSIDFTGTAPVSFTKNVINGTATIDDDQEPVFPLTLNAGEGPWSWTETQDITCSTDRSAYGETGSYGATVYNTATVTGSNGQTDSADADTTWLCEASFVDIYKTTNGDAPEPGEVDIQFTLFSGTTALETLSTWVYGANLQYQTALVPDASYTICEYPVPAGYTFEVRENGSIVQTYAGPPGATNPTGEIQCFDFTAPHPDTQVTITFNIENSFPGGAPRTPGYWKNWNTCSGGNQAATAEHLGGVAEGVFLLDNLLPQTVGDLPIETCEDGVSILDARDIITGRKRASDAGYTLARAYLAALLNQGAGACVPTDTFDLSDYELGDALTFQQVLNAAQQVLDNNDFVGTEKSIDKRDPDKDLALYLYEIIDDYNNGYICTGEESH